MLQPLGKRVLVSPKSPEEKTESGIFIPKNAQNKTNQGVVVSLGEVQSVSLGDTVLWNKHSGTEVSTNGETYLLLSEDDLLGILKD